MTAPTRREAIRTRIWREEAEADNPFATRAAYCRGYDVYRELVGRARWVEMLFLLFRDNLPSVAALDMLEALAVALANPGPRDPSVHAAMSGGVGGSPAAASLMAALAVGAGRYGGAREVHDAMTLWAECGTDLDRWSRRLPSGCDEAGEDIWPSPEHPPGFDPNGATTPTIVVQLLHTLAGIAGSPVLAWLETNRPALEAIAKCPLAIAGVAAAAMADLELAPKEGEMLYLLLRLPGAAAHALEQETSGFRNFPFFAVELENDPLREPSP